MAKIFNPNSSWFLRACIVMAVGGLILAGCSKKPATASAPPSEPAATVAAGQPDASANLAELTQALRKYAFEHQRVPASFNEWMAASKPATLPVPPSGKKFAIDVKSVQVVLVNQ